MKEWQRTVLLLVLLAIAVGFIIWSRQANLHVLTQGIR